MTTAQVLFEQYKVLPPRIQQQFKKLIVAADQPAASRPAVAEDDDDSGDTIRISLEALHSSIEQVKLLKAGKLKTQSARAMLAEVKAELTAEDMAGTSQSQKAA